LCSDAFEGDLDRFDEAVFIEVHAVDAGDAMVTIRFTEWTAVIDDVVEILAGDMDDGVVARAGGNFGILLQDFADPGEWPEWRIGDGIGDGIVRTCPTTLGPHEVVLAVALEHERSFDVALGSDFLENCSIEKGFEAAEIILEPDNVAVRQPP